MGSPCDSRRCPLCGAANACAVAEGKGEGRCWCFEREIPADVLERVPADLRGKACVCRTCATAETGPEGALAVIRARG